MVNDRKIIAEVKKLKKNCAEYLGYVQEVSQNAYSDRMLEELILTAKNVNDLYVENTIEK